MEEGFENLCIEFSKFKNESKLGWTELRDIFLINELREINRNLANIDLTLLEVVKR